MKHEQCNDCKYNNEDMNVITRILGKEHETCENAICMTCTSDGCDYKEVKPQPTNHEHYFGTVEKAAEMLIKPSSEFMSEFIKHITGSSNDKKWVKIWLQQPYKEQSE